MAVVNLGNIKHAPIINVFSDIKHVWRDEEKVGKSVKLDIPFVFYQNKTYIVFVRSKGGKVIIDGSEVSVDAIEIFTNRIKGFSSSGGAPFNFTGNDYSFGITLPTSGDTNELGVYISRPTKTSAASLFDVCVCEL